MGNYLEKLWMIFVHPKEFFASVEKEESYTPSLFFYVVTFLIMFTFSMVLDIPRRMAFTPVSWIVLVISLVFGIIFMAAIAFATPFITAGVVHLGVLIFKGKNGFFNTYKATTYGMMVGVGYGLLAAILQAILFQAFPVDTRAANPLTAILKYYLSPAFIAVIVVSFASWIHMLVVQTIGVAKFQNMSNTRAFWSVFLIPLLLLVIILGIAVLMFWALLLMVPVA